MLTLLLGTDWTVNRATILDRIAQDVANQNSGRILMVPELISHETERRLCMSAGDACSRFAEVLTFSRLASRVASSVGHSAPSCLDNGGRVVVLASAVRQLRSKLKAYASVETRPEFLVGLVDMIDEFKRCCISATDLLNASKVTTGALAQKLEELGLIMETYDALCSQGRCDPRDQMTWLLEELEDSDFGQNHVFYIDGFPDFTRQHFAILRHLIQTSNHVTISLNCDKPGSTAMAFEKAGQTAMELVRLSKELDIDLEICYLPERNDGLSSLRKNIFQGHIDNKVSVLDTYHAETIYQECCIAAERVIDLVMSGSRYRDVGIVCADLGQYRNTLELVFEKMSVPVYISGTEDILEKSAIAIVVSALDVVINGFEKNDVFKYLKSMLSPLSLDECDRVENYALMWNIRGNAWLQEWTNHPNGLGQTWSESSTQRLRMLNDTRVRAIEPLMRLRDQFHNATKLSQQIKALYAFMEDISLSQKLRTFAQAMDAKGDNRNAQILNQLWDILLSAIEQLYDVLGDTYWEEENFTRLFKLLLSQYDVGTIPPVLDSVTAGPVSAMRCQQCKHLIVLGAQEGSMPGYGGSTGVLTDYERTQLRKIGVQLTGGALEGVQAEFAEIYGVFCGAEETISVSYTGAQPSFVYRRLSELSGESRPVGHVLGTAIGNPMDAAAYLLRMDADNMSDYLGLQSECSQIQARKEYEIGSLSGESVNKLYGDELYLSASQIDRQAECRLMYFLKYGLRAKERKPATIDPAEFGTYVHAVLEKTAQEVMEKGGFRQVSVEETLEIAKKHSFDYAKERFSELDSERLSFLFQRNVQELELIVLELWNEMQNSKFAPAGFEVGFGKDELIQAIDVSGKNMAASLRGFVDRVDTWKTADGTYFRVVDYKTGKKDFDYCDIFNGYGLQMLLYLFALEDQGAGLLGENAAPSGVQYFPARVPYVPADGILTPEEAEEARVKLWKRKGLLLSDEKVLKAMENAEIPVRMPYTKKKDGSISGDIATENQFSLLKSYVFFLVGKMVDDIASGCITPNPYTRGTSHDACAYCPYAMICHKETVSDRRNYKTMTAERFWDEIEKEMSRNG